MADPLPQPRQKTITSMEFLQRFGHGLSEFERAEASSFGEVSFISPLLRSRQYPARLPEPHFDDPTHRLVCYPSDHIGYRYEILGSLGRGTFADVVRAFDHKTGSFVAIKIIRSEPQYLEAAESEADVLLYLQGEVASDLCIRMLAYLVFRGHFCIVFELIHGGDLYSTLRRIAPSGFGLGTLRTISRDLVLGLAEIHAAAIIHCDVKPENILLREQLLFSDNPIFPGLKIVDFGYSCPVEETVFSTVQTSLYRAPEVVVEAPYDTSIDMWSFGCVLAELHTGHPLFNGETMEEIARLHIHILGTPPPEIANAGDLDLYARFYGNVPEVEAGSTTLAVALNLTPFHPLLNLIASCLRWLPDERITASAAMDHPFFFPLAPVVVAPMPASASAPVSLEPNRACLTVPGRESFNSTSSGRSGSSRKASDLSEQPVGSTDLEDPSGRESLTLVDGMISETFLARRAGG